MTNVRTEYVAEPEQMQFRVSNLLMNGYSIVQQDKNRFMLVRPKQFNIGLALVGFLFCGVGLVIYVIWFMTQSDSYVELILGDPKHLGFRPSELLPDAPPPKPWPPLQLSHDGARWWDGALWRPTIDSFPPQALQHRDGARWWDGVRWRPIPPAG